MRLDPSGVHYAATKLDKSPSKRNPTSALILIPHRHRPGDHVLLLSPGAQINLPATFAAEGTVLAGFSPFDFLAASGAVHDGGHGAGEIRNYRG